MAKRRETITAASCEGCFFRAKLLCGLALHADHFLDLVPFSYALTYAPRQQPVPVDRWPGTDCPACPKLFAPTGATETFRRVVGAWGNEDLIENAFELHEYSPDQELAIGT